MIMKLLWVKKKGERIGRCAGVFYALILGSTLTMSSVGPHRSIILHVVMHGSDF